MIAAEKHQLIVATLNWNRPDDTIACLQSAAQLTYPAAELVVVDNHSSDDSVERIQAAVPQATILRNDRNAGFAGGCNMALRYALERGADYILLINNDTILDPTMIERMLAYAAPDVGMLVPAIFYMASPSQPWSIGGMCHPITLEKTGDSARQFGQIAHAGAVERDYVVGCAMLFQRAALERAGMFDERFFMYYEDMDLSLRFRQAGYRILLVPTAHMWHKVSASSGGSNSPGERYWMARSSVIFFRKHARGLRWLAIVPFRTLSALRTTLRLLRSKNSVAARAYWRGLRDGIQENPCT